MILFFRIALGDLVVFECIFELPLFFQNLGELPVREHIHGLQADSLAQGINPLGLLTQAPQRQPQKTYRPTLDPT